MGRLIKQINFPADLRKFSKDDLKQISSELRDELIDVVSETGGHLGAGLGVVELTSRRVRVGGLGDRRLKSCGVGAGR